VAEVSPKRSRLFRNGTEKEQAVVEMAQKRSRLWQKWHRKGAGCGRSGTDKEHSKW
jgi:hypothetical protein